MISSKRNGCSRFGRARGGISKESRGTGERDRQSRKARADDLRPAWVNGRIIGDRASHMPILSAAEG